MAHRRTDRLTDVNQLASNDHVDPPAWMDMGTRAYEGASLLIAPLTGIEESMTNQVRLIVRMQTDPDCRRQGHATKLLRQVCMEADDALTVLVLTPTPFLDAPLNATALAVFYRRFGFETIQTDPTVLMSRAPRPTKRYGKLH